MKSGSERIGPTAHYTAAVWAGAGLSHPALSTAQGRVLFNSLRPVMAAAEALGGPRLETFLLARHRIIDQLLGAAIDSGRVTQVIEIAAGMSPRGWRLASRYGAGLTYIEADLPRMALRKRAALKRAGLDTPHNRVSALDALSDQGPESLAAIAETLDPGAGVAIVTEGLLNYLERANVEGLWRRIAIAMEGFPTGLYLSDLHLRRANEGLLPRAFTAGLSAFVRGSIHLHYGDEAEAIKALRRAGLTDAVLHRPQEFAGQIEGCDRPAAQLVRVIEARVG